MSCIKKCLHIGTVFTFDKMKLDKISVKFDKLNTECITQLTHSIYTEVD